MHTEENIKQLIAGDNTDAIRLIFDKYYKVLCVYSMRYVSDIADAEDVVQDVLASFWKNKQGKPFKGSVRAYLFTAVSRAAIKRVSRKRTICFEDVGPHIDRDFEKLLEQADDERSALCKRMETEINKLPERSREIFNMIVATDLSYSEIGSQLGISVNTVKTLYYNGLRKLRENTRDDKLFFLCLLAIFM